MDTRKQPDESSPLWLEWLQCKAEGRQLSRLKSQVLAALESGLPDHKLMDQLPAMPLRRDFSWQEPDSLPEIQAARPEDRLAFSPGYQPETCRDQLMGAWYGGLAGERLAAYYDKSTPAAPMDFSPPPCYRKASCCGFVDSESFQPGRLFTASILSLTLLEQCGFSFSGEDVLDHLLEALPYSATEHSCRAAYRSRVMGLSPPETALYRNPCREWNGGMLQGAFWGLVLQGAPKAAAAAAYRYVSASHRKNGIYGGMFLAAAVSAAGASTDLPAVLTAALGEIPATGRLQDALCRVRTWTEQELSAEEITSRIHREYNDTIDYGYWHVIPNAMIITMALLLSGYDMSRALHLAIHAGFDRAGNAAAVGTVLGMMTGASHMDSRWLTPFEWPLASPIYGYGSITVDKLVAATIEQLGLLQRAKPLIK